MDGLVEKRSRITAVKCAPTTGLPGPSQARQRVAWIQRGQREPASLRRRKCREIWMRRISPLGLEGCVCV